MLITTSLVGEFALEFPDRPAGIHWIAGLIASLLFFGSVLFHELSHSILARRLGHPVRGITLFIFGGVSEIEEEAHTPSAEFWIAVIGPFSSFFLALFFWILQPILATVSDEMALLSQRLAFVNLVLGIFNLFPAFPLDGGRVLRSVYWKTSGNLQDATRRAARIGQAVGFVLIVTGIWLAFGLGLLLNGIWIGFLGWFLNNAAENSVRQMEFRQVLDGVQARDIMSDECPEVSEDITLSELVEQRIVPSGNHCYAVTRDGILLGLVSIHEVRQIARDYWPVTHISQVIKPLSLLRTAAPETSVEKVLQLLDDEKIHQIPVIDGQRLVGWITREHLLNVIRTRIALGIGGDRGDRGMGRR